MDPPRLCRPSVMEAEFNSPNSSRYSSELVRRMSGFNVKSPDAKYFYLYPYSWKTGTYTMITNSEAA